MSQLNLRDARLQKPLNQQHYHEWVLPSGIPWALFYRFKQQYLIRFCDLADFILSNDGLDVNAYPAPGVSDQTIDHLYLNLIVPLALSRQFKLVLHGSAVEVDNSAVAFIGMSGRGKSTLAAEFSTKGYSFLTDDSLQIAHVDDCFIIQPSHPSIRLWDDSRDALIPSETRVAPEVDYTPKARLLADERVAFCKKAQPLKHVYFLGRGDTDTISITPVKGQDVIIELAQNSFLLDMEKKEMLSNQFEQFSALAQHPIFYYLDYPRRYEFLTKVRDEIVRHIMAGV